jgi:hypothetical protein
MEPGTECLPFANRSRDNSVHDIPVRRNRHSGLVEIRAVRISRLLVPAFTKSGKVSIIVQVVAIMGHTSKDIHYLKKASRYRVSRGFADFYNNQFTPGEILTFVEYHFLPYHGGYTIVFQERNLYLQEQENAHILDSLGDYLSSVTD